MFIHPISIFVCLNWNNDVPSFNEFDKDSCAYSGQEVFSALWIQCWTEQAKRLLSLGTRRYTRVGRTHPVMCARGQRGVSGAGLVGVG